MELEEGTRTEVVTITFELEVIPMTDEDMQALMAAEEDDDEYGYVNGVPFYTEGAVRCFPRPLPGYGYAGVEIQYDGDEVTLDELRQGTFLGVANRMAHSRGIDYIAFTPLWRLADGSLATRWAEE